MTFIRRHPLAVAATTLALAACASLEAAPPDAAADAAGRDTSAIDGIWKSLAAAGHTLTVTASQPLLVSAPFYGIEVRKNGVDITDDIDDVRTLSPTSWQYTFDGAHRRGPRVDL